MMIKEFSKFSWAYAALSLLYIVGLILLQETVVFYLKFALIPVLILAVFTSSAFEFKNLLLAALAFSWLGDIVLSYAPQGELFFIIGLIAFLIAHIFYILLFYRSINKTVQSRGYPSWAWSMLVIYVCVLLALLFPHLGPLKIPVCIYALVIGMMLGMAIRGWAHWPLAAGASIVLGASSFVLSDTTLAINKFYTPLPWASVLIMSTYLFAQWALVRGMLSMQNVPKL